MLTTERRTIAFALTWLVAAIVYMLSVHTPYSPDSHIYISAASSLMQNGSLTIPFSPTYVDSLPAPYAKWPPGYPASIALLAQTGVSAQMASILLSVLGLAIGLIFFWKFTKDSSGAAVGFLLLAVSWETAVVGFTAWSEGLFFAALMGCAWAMSRWLQETTGSMRFILIAAGCAALAMQMRYAGLFLIPALIWITWRRGLRLQKIAGTCLYLLAAVPLGVWFARNSTLAQTWRGGLPTETEWWRAVAEMALSVAHLCFVLVMGTPVAGAMIGFLLLVGLGGLLYRRRRQLANEPAVIVSIAFFLSLMLGTVLARAMGHMWILDSRIIWPAWIFAIFLAAHMASSFTLRIRVWAPALLGMWITVHTTHVLLTFLDPSIATERPPQSELSVAADDGSPILCNRGWDTWHLTGRSNYTLPLVYYLGDEFGPDTLSAWSARRGVRIALWIDEKESDDDIKAKYGPMGLLMARADSAYFTVIERNGDLTWMEIRRSP